MKNRTLKANYGLGEQVINVISFVYTRVFWKKARLIRISNRIRGKKAISYGVGFTLGYSNRIEVNGETNKINLEIGENCIFGDYNHIVANCKVTIGDNALLASRIFISDTNHGLYKDSNNVSKPSEAPKYRNLHFEEVSIGDNVWIGENVAILPGVHIGNGCVIGANSVVTKSIPSNSIAVGNPVRIIKRYNESNQRWI